MRISWHCGFRRHAMFVVDAVGIYALLRLTWGDKQRYVYRSRATVRRRSGNLADPPRTRVRILEIPLVQHEDSAPHLLRSGHLVQSDLDCPFDFKPVAAFPSFVSRSTRPAWFAKRRGK